MPKDIAFELIKNSLVVIGSIVFGALLAIFYDQIGEIQYKIYKIQNILLIIKNKAK